MDTKEIREMSQEERRQKVVDLKQEYFNLRFQHKTDQLENSSSLKKTRRNIAKLKTIIRENQ